jgi:hypothetical protein
MRCALLVLGSAAALLAGNAGARATTGISGVLYRGPITPVCQVGTPCDAPAPGMTLAFTRAGHVFRVRTGVGGHFSIALHPGIYAVRVVPTATIGSRLSPRAVRVPVDRWARVRLMLDTGIR